MIRDIFIVSMFSFWMSCDVVAERLQHHDFFVSNERQKKSSQHLAGVEIVEDTLRDVSKISYQENIQEKTDLDNYIFHIVHHDFFHLMYYVAQSLNDHYLLVQLNMMKNSKNIVGPQKLSEFLLAFVSSVDGCLKDAKIAVILNKINVSGYLQNDATDEVIVKLIRQCRDLIRQHKKIVYRSSGHNSMTIKLLESFYHKISEIKSDLHLVTDSVETLVYIQILLSSIHFALHSFYDLLHCISEKNYNIVFEQMNLMLMRMQSYVDGVAML